MGKLSLERECHQVIWVEPKNGIKKMEERTWKKEANFPRINKPFGKIWGTFPPKFLGRNWEVKFPTGNGMLRRPTRRRG